MALSLRVMPEVMTTFDHLLTLKPFHDLYVLQATFKSIFGF